MSCCDERNNRAKCKERSKRHVFLKIFFNITRISEIMPRVKFLRSSTGHLTMRENK